MSLLLKSSFGDSSGGSIPRIFLIATPIASHEFGGCSRPCAAVPGESGREREHAPDNRSARREVRNACPCAVGVAPVALLRSVHGEFLLPSPALRRAAPAITGRWLGQEQDDYRPDDPQLDEGQHRPEDLQVGRLLRGHRLRPDAGRSEGWRPEFDLYGCGE